MISVLLSGSIQRKEKEVQDRADEERRRVLDEQNWQQQKDQVECGHIAHIKPISKKQIPEKYPYTVGLFLVGIFGWCKICNKILLQKFYVQRVQSSNFSLQDRRGFMMGLLLYIEPNFFSIDASLQLKFFLDVSDLSPRECEFRQPISSSSKTNSCGNKTQKGY
jgi:hypothetical protein